MPPEIKPNLTYISKSGQQLGPFDDTLIITSLGNGTFDYEAGGDDSLAGETINAYLPGTLDPGSSHNLVWPWLDLLGNDLLALLLLEIHRDISEGDDRNRYPCEKL